ncbi:fasciclin domain-containing protein [Tellurirhabdus rosea]|uniref:fasciclin domain-containing protein n=1 Tax=Tellurirhabdus rosea TaxID=2674997 RepID=UPI002253B95F|nr:fasciclin domain-containing protein [Tellurirhabdus rosea]
MKNRFSVLATLRKVALATATVLAFLSVTGCDNDDDATPKAITDIVVEDANFSILEAAVIRAGLGDALRSGTLTVFAPTDAAFRAYGVADAAAVAALPVDAVRGILQYHVLNSRVAAADIPANASNTATRTLSNQDVYITKTGTNVFVNGAQVTQADIQASNGVIHVINQVLAPPPAAQNGNILGVIASLPNMTLVTAAIARVAAVPANAALATALTTQQFTVFAPNDAAFQAAGYANASAISTAPIDALQRILLNHVVPGRIYSNNLSTGNVTSAGNGTLAVTVGGSGVTVKSNGIPTAANVTRANQTGTNGVVHVIDRVLVP